MKQANRPNLTSLPVYFSRESISMIAKISLDSPSMKPTFAQELVSSRPSSAKSKRLTPASVFAITSGKGGVGKTNVVANLAAALTLRKKRVMVIDADLGLANLDLFLGVRPVYTLADFFTGLVALDEIIIPNRDGILLLPGASGVQEITSLRHDQKIALLTELDALSHEIDLVLVDTGSGISDAVTYFATSAQEIVVVVTPEPSSMTDAYALIKVLASGHHEKRFLDPGEQCLRRRRSTPSVRRLVGDGPAFSECFAGFFRLGAARSPVDSRRSALADGCNGRVRRTVGKSVRCYGGALDSK